MGTSLSGLTPATTFDGLLKTSDNDALDATLKTIGTGDGTDSVLQLSNSALKINGDATFLNQETIFQNASDLSSTALRIKLKPYSAHDNAATNIESYNDDNRWLVIKRDTTDVLKFSGSRIGVYTSAAANTRFHIKGSGATSATTSLLVQNSAGSDLFKVRDNGETTIGSSITVHNTHIRAYHSLELKTYTDNGYETNLVVTGNGAASKVGIGESTPTARLHVKGSGNTSATNAFFVENSDGTQLFKINDNRDVYLGTSSNYIHRGTVFQGDYTAPGDWNFGTISDLGAKLGIKGSGATSATTALLVQNSAGTDMMTMRDDGVFILGAAGNRKFFEGTVVNSKFRVIDNSSLHTVHADGSNNPRVFLRSGPNNSEPNSHYVANYINGTYIGKDVVTPTSTLHIKGSGNDATTTALLVQNSDGDSMAQITDNGGTTLKAFGASNTLILDATSNTSSFEMRGAGAQKFRIQASSSSTRFTPNGSGGLTFVGNGIFTGGAFDTADARLHVKGSGATSATTALLVENSAGTELLKVQDDGVVALSNIRATGNLTLGSSGANRYLVTNGQIHPLGNQDLGRNNLTAYHWDNIYSTGVTHITDNTTSSTTLDSTAKLQVDSTTQGFLPPRMTTTQRDAITSPASGLMVYNTTTNKAQCYNGTAWQDLF